jgi:hypothetical protein
VPEPFPTDSQADRNDGGERNEKKGGLLGNIHGSIHRISRSQLFRVHAAPQAFVGNQPAQAHSLCIAIGDPYGLGID